MSNRIEDLIEKARHYENLWHEALDENKRLEAEVNLLKGQVNYWRIEAECDHGRWLRCLEDLEKLRASSFVTAVPSHQYERIVRAGDLMLKFAAANMPYPPYATMAKDWNSAKNGWDAAKEGETK
jgi:hypothetical protein